MQKKLDLLQKQLEFFAGQTMPLKLRQQLQECAQERRYPKNTLLLSLGEQPKEIYFISKGLCRSYYLDYNGKEVTRFFILEGDFCFTEIQILEKPSELCVECLEACEGLCFQNEDLERLQNSLFMKNAYIGALKQNIRYKLCRERMFLIDSATKRYQQFQKQYPDLEHRIKQSQLASYLGIEAVSLSRIRRALRKEKRDRQ